MRTTRSGKKKEWNRMCNYYIQPPKTFATYNQNWKLRIPTRHPNTSTTWGSCIPDHRLPHWTIRQIRPNYDWHLCQKGTNDFWGTIRSALHVFRIDALNQTRRRKMSHWDRRKTKGSWNGNYSNYICRPRPHHRCTISHTTHPSTNVTISEGHDR